MISKSSAPGSNSSLSSSLKPFEGDLTSQNETVKFIQNRILVLRHVPADRLVDEIMLYLRPSVHQDGGYLDLYVGGCISPIRFAQILLS